MPVKPDRPAKPVPSVSLIVMRDGTAGLEVLMLERHRDLSFAAGAVVFPGGKIDPGDLDAAERYSQPKEAGERARRLAAVRELFEETGLLLADGSPDFQKLTDQYRDKIARDEMTLAALAEQEDLVFDLNSFQPFAHWITPVIAPRRFDTWFYLVPAPENQQASADGGEATGLVWRPPSTIVQQGMAGAFRLMFPTRVNLQKLAAASSVADAIQRAEAQSIHTVLPEVRIENGRKTIHIPADAGYGRIESTEREADTR